MKMDKMGCQRAAHHHDNPIPSDTSTTTPERSNYFPVSTHKFYYCSAHISPLWKCRNRGDAEIEEARLREQGRYGWRMEGKNEKERLVFMPGSQGACKSPRSVVEDSRRLIVIHHSWQPHRSGRAWQHSPVWEEQREGKQEERQIGRDAACGMCKLTLPCLKQDWWRTTRWGDKCELGEEEKEQLVVSAALCIPQWASVGNSRAAAGVQRGNRLVYPEQLLLIITSTHSNPKNLLLEWGLRLLLSMTQACPPLDPNLLVYWKANLLAEFNLYMFS